MNNFYFGEQMKQRTKNFAVRIVKLFQALPKTTEANIIGKQLLRSATSVAANYRAVCRARSKKEFYAKLCIVVEEADETLFWIEIIEETNILPSTRLIEIKKEAEEILKICSKARKNAKPNSNNHKLIN